MSIPVTLHAVVKRPQLLEGGGAKLLQVYLQALRDFNAELRSSGCGDVGMGGANSGGSDMKRTN